MTQVKAFVLNHFKSLVVVISFIATMYVQHVNNTAQVAELKTRCAELELKIEDQYKRIDAIKLDKAVFEATMTQFNSIQADIREMRSDIKELLKK